MKISIITVCFQSAGTIRTAVESVLAQRDVDCEYIVVDGGSDDGTVAAVEGYRARFAAAGRRFVVVSESDRGMYDALNKGIALAQGDVVGILNADDALADCGVLARIAAGFVDDLDCVYGKVFFVKELGGKPLRRCFARLWRPWMLQWGYMPPHPAIFIRRECFDKWGGYVPDRSEYRIAADYELLIRFFRVNRMRSKYVKLYTTAMRTGGVSTKDVEARRRLNSEIIKANRGNGYFCCWPMLLPKYAVKIWEYVLPRFGIM